MIRVFVGTDRNMAAAERVLEHSIRRHTRDRVSITWMRAGDPGWTVGPGAEWNIGRLPGAPYPRDGEGWGTEFSAFRFAVPELAGFAGRAVYLDVDMVVLGDLAELMETPLETPWGGAGGRTAASVIDCEAFGSALWWPRLRELRRSGRAVPWYTRLLRDHGALDGSVSADWDCRDGHGRHAGTRLIHFTDMRTQPWSPWPDRFPRRSHPRPELARLFRTLHDEATSEHPLRPLDVLVAALPRSGSSMLCNLLTVPPEAVVLYEPMLHDLVLGRWCRRQVQDLGYDGRPDAWNTLRWAAGHRRWGAKEVHAPAIRAGFERHRPSRIVLLVRDPREAALSAHDWTSRTGGSLSARGAWIAETARELVRLQAEAPERCLVVRYEELVTDPEALGRLARRLGWPAPVGDVSRGLATWLGRAHEVARHGGSVTSRSVGRVASTTDPLALAYADAVAAACARFRSVFGYS